MSDAKVQFHRVEDGRERSWASSREPVQVGQEQAFSFACPKHERRCGNLVIAGRTGLKRDPNGLNGGIAQWDWDGNVEAPTFAPSVNCKGCWHGYVRKGRCVDVHDKDEPEHVPSVP